MCVQAQRERDGIAPTHLQIAPKGTGWSESHSGPFTLGKAQYPLYMSLRGPAALNNTSQ